MRLINGELRPGIVLEVLDAHGTITASVHGLFSKEDIGNLPPIYAWPTGGSNSFNTPRVGDEVWVLFFTDNPEQLYWFKKDNFIKNNDGYNINATFGINGSNGGSLMDQPGINVVSSSEGSNGQNLLYNSDDMGWVMQNNQSSVQLDNEGSITLNNGSTKGVIDVSDDSISLGAKGTSTHPACHGDKVASLFENIIRTLTVAAEICKNNPHTSALGVFLEESVKKYKDDADYINSDIVTLE